MVLLLFKISKENLKKAFIPPFEKDKIKSWKNLTNKN